MLNIDRIQTFFLVTLIFMQPMKVIFKFKFNIDTFQFSNFYLLELSLTLILIYNFSSYFKYYYLVTCVCVLVDVFFGMQNYFSHPQLNLLILSFFYFPFFFPL